ncbi:hypothetical protein BDY17DRAFT_5247 [Neohortaea acidophila]|uniref:Uncharacterized protein n=1 Tax=Neohortaea acidophila TaxID=245834 RepID=A0A6A6Q561_9PEZI|nr:uncharacterized protein BDY17DRAFT_5247 [Neohortaea acidophila]KAF2487179.1 hypothetical protein BDY17DRAFT_5247 [Neohortaea acidophila]
MPNYGYDENGFITPIFGPGVTTTRQGRFGGAHFTITSTSFGTTAGAFNAFTSTAHTSSRNVFAASPPPRRRQGPGLLGAAFGVMGDLLAARQQARENLREPSTRDERPDSRRTGSHDSTWSSPPPSRGGPARRSSRYNRGESDEYFPDSDESYDRRSRRGSTRENDTVYEDLADLADHHRQAIKRCNRRLDRATRQPDVDAAKVERLLDELETHEESYAQVKKDMEKASRGQGSSSRQTPPRSTRPSQRQEQTFDEMFAGDPFHGIFGTWSRMGGPARPPPSANTRQPNASSGSHPSFAFNWGIDSDFDDLYNAMQDEHFDPRSHFTFSPMPDETPKSAPRFQPAHPPQAFNPQPPKNMLKAEEARKLFAEYDRRWNVLAPADPNIPFPCRGLHRHGLAARDTIWAPTVTSPVSAWSESQVHQANAQAFFIGAVGLQPTYREAPGSGKLVTGFDRTRATLEQVRALVEILKKEKGRWHSDRLGRRNGGGVGAAVNEGLQRDERARAVFHAVCELAETAQAR